MAQTPDLLVDPLEVAGLWSGFYRARDVWDQFSQLAFCNILVGTVPVTDATRSKISTPKLEWKICGRPLEWWQESSKRPPEA